MRLIFSNSQKGLSLVEVLVATSIIAVAMYGMMLAFTAQQAANTATRQRQMIKTLHYQLVNEILSSERNPLDLNWDDSSFSSVANVTNPALGSGKTLQYKDRVVSIYGAGNPPYILESQVSWSSPTGSTQDHVIKVYFLREKN